MQGIDPSEPWTELYHQSQERAAKLSAIERTLADLKKRHIRDRNALVEIIRAADQSFPSPMHYEVRAAISRAARLLSGE